MYPAIFSLMISFVLRRMTRLSNLTPSHLLQNLATLSNENSATLEFAAVHRFVNLIESRRARKMLRIGKCVFAYMSMLAAGMICLSVASGLMMRPSLRLFFLMYTQTSRSTIAESATPSRRLCLRNAAATAYDSYPSLGKISPESDSTYQRLLPHVTLLAETFCLFFSAERSATV